MAAATGLVYFVPINIACKTPGNSCVKDTGISKGYVVRVQVCSTIPFETTVIMRDAMVSLNGAAATPWEVTVDPQSPYYGGTVADPDAPGTDPNNPVLPDPVIILPAATAGSPSCAIIDFGIQGTPSSENVSINGSAPYSWTAPGNSISSGTGMATMTAPSSPPCSDCAPPPAP